MHRSLRLCLLCALAVLVLASPSFAERDETVLSEVVAGSAPGVSKAPFGVDGNSEDGVSADPATMEKSVAGMLKVFPGLGKQEAALLKLAEEGLGINLSKLELKKMVPMLADLQKNVHSHYLLTKGTEKARSPSSLLKRVIGRKSQYKVLKSMKQFAPNTDDSELLQQLDAVTQLMHELHKNPDNSMTEVLKHVASALGLNLKEEDMESLNKHVQWAQEFVEKLVPNFPELLGSHAPDEL